MQDLRDQLLVQPSPMAQRFKGMPFSGMRVPGQGNRVDAMLPGLQHLLVCAGGGYQCIVTYTEGLMTAAELNAAAMG